MKTPFLYVALDYENNDNIYRAAEELAEVRSDHFGYKVNLDFLVGQDTAEALKPIHKLGKEVFGDMKMRNGKRTMAATARKLDAAGVNAINSYCDTRPDFLSAVREALSHGKYLFGVTVLTHYTDKKCMEDYGRSLKEAVMYFAQIGKDAKCDGIILPGTTLDVVADMDILKVVAAIRSDWYEDKKANYQEQIVTPTEALAGGAHVLVCGSPIIKSKDRREALKRVLGEMGVY